MPEPRSDWTCLGRKCAGPEGEAPVFEASTKATHCPECGSKRIRRIYSANVGTKGVAKFVDRLVEPQYEHQKATYESAKAARIANGHMRPGDAVIHGPASTLGSMMSKVHPAFAGASAGAPNRSAKVEGVSLGTPLPRGGAASFMPKGLPKASPPPRG